MPRNIGQDRKTEGYGLREQSDTERQKFPGRKSAKIQGIRHRPHKPGKMVRYCIYSFRMEKILAARLLGRSGYKGSQRHSVVQERNKCTGIDDRKAGKAFHG